MKLRQTPPTRGLVGIAMHVLFGFFIIRLRNEVVADQVTPPCVPQRPSARSVEIHLIPDELLGLKIGDVNLHPVDMSLHVFGHDLSRRLRHNRKELQNPPLVVGKDTERFNRGRAIQ
jgi:hypothetical protein